MLKMLVNWYKTKSFELEMKALFYGSLREIMDGQNDVITLVKNLYNSLKDTPMEELKDQFIKELAEIIHRENSEK